MKQLALDIGLVNQPTLDQVDAQTNPALVNRVTNWLQDLGYRNTQAPCPAIYIWGESGCGKSHLLGAIAHELNKRGLLFGDMTPDTPPGQRWSMGWSTALIDDVHALDADGQTLAFQWFIDAQGHQKTIIAAGRLPPADLTVRDDLRSRLGWGDVFAMQSPDDARRVAILQGHAQAKGLKLNVDVIEYLLVRFSRDLGHLVGLLDRLDVYAMQRKRPITIALLRDLMQDL